VDLIGDGQCVFQDCVATLEDPRGKPLALSMLSDSSRVMKMDPVVPRQQTPQLRLERCFIRGQGDLVAVRSPRPLDLKVSNSLVVLAGSFLNVEANSKEPTTAARILVELTYTTAFLADYVVRLRADKDGKEPVPVQINPAKNCLFASADGKAMIHLDGLEITNEQMKHLFSWENGRQNAYSKFQPMLDQQPKEGEMPLASYDQQRWRTFTGEADGLFLTSVKFAEPPSADPPLAKSLAQSNPAQFKIKTEAGLQGYGADVDQLPKPLTDDAGGTPSP